VYLDTSSATVALMGGILSGNSASGEGGALYIRSSRSDAKPSLSATMFTLVENNQAGAAGGGVFMQDARARLNTAIVRFNSAPAGGGIAATLGAGAATSNADGPLLTFFEGSIRENSAAAGAGVHLTDARAFFNGPVLRFNRATGDGGAIRAVATRPDVNNFLRLYLTTVRCGGNGEADAPLEGTLQASSAGFAQERQLGTLEPASVSLATGYLDLYLPFATCLCPHSLSPRLPSLMPTR
jgi:hypothetical protein